MPNSRAKSVWETPTGKFMAGSGKLWKELGQSGGEVIHRLDEEPDFLDRVSRFMRGGGFVFQHHDQLRDVMGNNVFGVDEWEQLFGVLFTQSQIEQVYKFPLPIDMLRETCQIGSMGKIYDTHFAFIGIDFALTTPITIKKLYELSRKNIMSVSGIKEDDLKSSWIVEETCKFGWYLAYKGPAHLSSVGKDFNNLRFVQCMEKDYRIPSVVELVNFLLLSFMRNGPEFMKEKQLRSSTQFPNEDSTLCVTTTPRIVISPQRINYSDIGLAAFRKM
ncbi:MAG: hypothetical protein ABIH52_02225 [Candidatus Aenigmatarchaeota archaeon]|nr:hypothetical protein [Nanoarchaeota archaeon]